MYFILFVQVFCLISLITFFYSDDSLVTPSYMAT